MKVHEDPYPETDEFVTNHSPEFKIDDLVFLIRHGQIEKGQISSITISKRGITYTIAIRDSESSSTMMLPECQLYDSFESVIDFLRKDYNERYV